MIAALALFFFTALAGRLWCGYACPQTVWTEVFLWMERWTEGDRAKRMKLDAAPWSARRSSCARGASTCCGSCSRCGPASPSSASSPRSATWRRGCRRSVGRLGNLLGAVLRAGDLGQRRLPARAGVQVHVPVCALPERDVRPQHADHRLRPAPRRAARRAPRDWPACSSGARPACRGCRGRSTWPRRRQPKRGAAHRRAWHHHLDRTHRSSRCRSSRPTQLGDCIDCTLCVQVCPTGIDIRNGLQYECIACGACIDACDEVMDKHGLSEGPDPLRPRRTPSTASRCASCGRAS
jgi:NAD-dependent dihydropyrimidine dehydrogenase PreA subunit